MSIKIKIQVAECLIKIVIKPRSYYSLKIWWSQDDQVILGELDGFTFRIVYPLPNSVEEEPGC